MAPKTPNTEEQISYNDALAELDDILAELEGDSVDVDHLGTRVKRAAELTQAAYRIGDSTSNIVTPLMPYFPLVVMYCQRHVKSTGIGTLTSLMLPYSLSFLVAWSALLMLFWMLGIPLGLQASYVYGGVGSWE